MTAQDSVGLAALASPLPGLHHEGPSGEGGGVTSVTQTAWRGQRGPHAWVGWYSLVPPQPRALRVVAARPLWAHAGVTGAHSCGKRGGCFFL
jgi:hypothetical protein